MADSSGKIPFRQEIHFEYGVASEVAPGVRRLVANNPSPFTFKGTNTYIVGQGEVAIIDPGPDDVSHLDAIMEALEGEKITHIILTHTHKDHSGCLQRLQSLSGAVSVGFPPVRQNRGTKSQSPSEGEFVDTDFLPDRCVEDGDVIEGAGWSLTAIHTPGHAPDHLCFDLKDQGVLFSGDHVMSWNTSVIAPPEGSMRDYLQSLEKLRGGDHEVYFPGHGGRVENPQRVVKAFLVHRSWREAAILESVKKGDHTISEIVKRVYKDLDSELYVAAAFSVLAHVEYLFERGRLSCDEPLPTLSSSFALP